MRKLLLFACALFGFMACTQNPIEEQSAIRTDAPETLRVGFEDDETRIQLNKAQKTVWTKDDLVSVFYRSDANQKWQYQGESGERVGDLKRVENATSTTKTTKTVVVYPYSESYWLNTDSYAIDATLPATQYYAEGSYGVGSNLMVSQSEFTQFSLKSVCGWLKLRLTGDGAVVKSIKFRGNDGEQVAGLIYVDTATAEATLATEMGGTDDNNAGGNLVFDDTILTEVVLDCGEGVELGAEATPFYISLPPQTFANGFTVEIEDTDGYVMEQSTAKTFVVERNTISPMAALEFVTPNHSTQPTPANNEIWYTNGSTTEATTPDGANDFGVNIVSNTYDAAKECWIITFDGKVTTIGDSAFLERSSLTSVTIPDSVTSIGEDAFAYCYSLTSVTIGDSATTIGDGAFAECTSLTGVYISDISAWCNISFSGWDSNPLSNGCNLYLNNELVTDLVIPSDITEIKPYVFSDCSSLTSVTIPDSVTTIGKMAFQDCSSLTSVTIGDSVTTIGDSAFRFCNSLTSVTIPDSVTEIGIYAFDGCTGELTVNCNIPSASNSYDGAFYGSKFTSVTIGDSVTTIGGSAFRGCSSLTSVTIPDSVTTIGGSAFSRCSSLTSVTIPDGVTTIRYSTFSSCSSLTSVTIPDSVTEIGDYAFSYCDSLTSVTIPDSVTLIGDAAFFLCSNLTSVYISDLSAWCRISFEDYSANPLDCAKNLYLNNKLVTDLVIPSDITEIKSYAFHNCDSLESVTIPDSVTTIGEDAFEGCSSLTSVTIPDSVTEIRDSAFFSCSSLTSVYCKATTPPVGYSSMFSYNASGRKIYVPMESVEAYKSAEYWSDYASSVVGYNF